MQGQTRTKSHGCRYVAINVLVVLALVLFLAPAHLTEAGAARAQPILLTLAAQQPESVVDVIVQKSSSGADVERLVGALGGAVTADLSIINSFGAQIRAGAVPTLASDAGVRWVSLDASWGETSCDQCVDTTVLTNSYVQTIGASSLWNQAPYLQGQSIGVAVVDSGISDHMDLNQAVGNQANGRGNASRVVATAKVIRPANGKDGYGHGTNVAGIIGGNGASSDGGRVGVAPKVNLVDVEVSNDNGVGRISDVIAGLQWVYQNHDRYNIRVVNLSLQSSQPEPYRTSPLDAAVEVLWFNRIVVVVAAGNGAKNGVLYPPANDPFVITVGATDDRGTPATNDDVVASFSAHGTTESGIAKPDLVAPGTNIISLLAERNEVLALQHPDHIVNGTARKHDDYFRMSGTSMSAAVTTGAVALLIQSNPRLTPDQVKNRLMTTARPVAGAGAGAGSLNISAAVASRSTNSSNTGLAVSRLLLKGSNPPLGWTSVNWESVNWESVNWESVNWESVNWESVNWESVNWESDVWN